MIKVLIVFFLLWFASALIRARRNQGTAKEVQTDTEELQSEEVDTKIEKRKENLLNSIQQAESDILNDECRLDHYTEKLSELDRELANIEIDIEFYQRKNELDKEMKARAAKRKLQDKIFSCEEKVRACDKRIAKSNHIKAMAQMELLA